jgi:hypothetical protein
MSNPGTTGAFDLSRARVIELALADVSAIGPGRRPTPEQRLDASIRFAELASSLAVDGVMRFLYERRELVLTQGTTQYTLPDDVWDVNDPLTYRESASEPTRTPLWPLSISDYMLLTNRSEEGRPAQYVVEKALTAAGEVAKVSFYQVPNLTGAVVEYPAILKVRDMNTDANTPSFPAKWLRMLRYGLAASMAFEYKVPSERYANMVRQFEMLKQECLDDDHERVNLQVVPWGSSQTGGGSWY